MSPVQCLNSPTRGSQADAGPRKGDCLNGPRQSCVVREYALSTLSRTDMHVSAHEGVLVGNTSELSISSDDEANGTCGQASLPSSVLGAGLRGRPIPKGAIEDVNS